MSGFVTDWVVGPYPEVALGKVISPGPPIDRGGAPANNVMRCFNPRTLPVHHAAAREFAICDRWFASMPGPTWPNRFFVHAAAASGQVDSPPWPKIAESYQGDGFSFPNGTIYDKIAAKGLKFRIYSGDGVPLTRVIKAGFGNIPWLDMTKFEADVSNPAYDACYTFIEPDYGPQPFEGLAGGHTTLQDDMHPPSDVRNAEALVDRVYKALRNSPLWESCVLVVTNDEHGGFYDHVPPPDAVAPGDGEVDNTHGFRFNVLGVRVPTIIISPWIPRNTIDHTQYDHTSILRTVEELFDLAPLTDRDNPVMCNSFTHLFSLSSARTGAPTTLARPWEIAFQANTGSLWVIGSDDRLDMRLGVVAGTSPSICAMPNGAWQAAYNSGSLWVIGTADDRGDMKLGMVAGTSPSICAMPNGTWQAAFQANTGSLWVIGTADDRGDMRLGMMAGTSPSICAMPNGTWQAAFQANDGNLWVIGTADDQGSTNLGMMKGTSPSICVLPEY
jgi:hypothetical protein